MKLKNILIAGALALASIGTASAVTTTIVITGSSAYRVPVVTAIQNLMSGSSGGTTGFTVGYTGTATTPEGSNAQIYKGTIAGNDVIIKTSWSGSAAGIQTVAATSPTKTVGVFTDGVSTAAYPGTSGITDPRNGVNQVRPDVAMADNTQSSTLFNGTSNGVTYGQLVTAAFPAVGTASTKVGVVPFVWCVSKSAPAQFDNMTAQAAQYIYTSVGYTLGSFLTGNNADEAYAVYGAGRDPDSGTRIVAFAETGIGATANTGIKQFKIDASGGAITSIALTTATTINGVAVPAGSNGEASGGTLAGLMNNTGPSALTPGNILATDGFFVTYLGQGVGNSDNLVAPARIIKYNGVAYSSQAVIEGAYTFWGYERISYRSGTTGVVKTVADKIADQIYTTTATIKQTAMLCTRQIDGGLVTSTLF